MIEVVYKNSDNPNTITFQQDGVAIGWSTVTRMVLSFAGSDVVVDSDIDASLINWSLGNGVIQFNLNDLAIPANYGLPATLKVYDPLHTDGQVLIHASSRQLYFRFVD